MSETNLEINLDHFKKPLSSKFRHFRKRDPKKTDRWISYDSDISNYEHGFEPVLKEGEHILDFVKNKPYPVVIDFLASSAALANLFEALPDKPKYGLSVSLEDERDDAQKQRDNQFNIHHITGDITRSSTWKVINKELNGRKADLIIERGGGALYNIPINTKLYGILMDKAWKLLSNQYGVMLIQTPNRVQASLANIPINEWLNTLRKTSIQVSYSGPTYASNEALKIIKTPDSPQALPFPS